MDWKIAVISILVVLVFIFLAWKYGEGNWTDF